MNAINSNVLDVQYNIIKDQAFTEDKILINNLFLYNLPEDATPENVSKYFQQFGKVSKVKCRNKWGFINFVDSKVATRVLEKQNHVFENCILRVQPRHSYYQPDGQKIIAQLQRNLRNESANYKTTSSYNNSIKLEQKALILKLNDDCLEHICKMLKPKEQINFALTCQRFCNILKMLSKAKYANLSTILFSGLTLWQTSIFLQIVGPQVKILTIDFMLSKCVRNFLALQCRNVKKLKAVSHQMNLNIFLNSLHKLISNMRQLDELDLININDDLIMVLKKLKNLKSLSISYNSDITGKNIHLLHGLETLCLIYCTKINSFYFQQMSENLKNLKYINISGCEYKSIDFNYILEHLKQLETIILSPNGESFNCLAKLPKLKHLEIHSFKNYPLKEQFIRNLVEHQVKQLEIFKLYNLQIDNFDLAALMSQFEKLKVLYVENIILDDVGLQKISTLTELEEVSIVYCNNICEKSAIEFLQHCLKLKQLDLSLCKRITSDFINCAVKLLKTQHEHGIRFDKINLVLSVAPSTHEFKLKDYSDVLEISYSGPILDYIYPDEYENEYDIDFLDQEDYENEREYESEDSFDYDPFYDW